MLVEGLLNFHTEPLRAAHDIRVFLAPPESMRRAWKLTRDCTRRGYTTHEVLDELDLRERDVGRLHPPAASARGHRRLRSARHAATGPSTSTPRWSCATRCATPTCRRCSARRPRARRWSAASTSRCCGIPGDTHPELAAELEEAVWQRMQYASHLRVQRLGEFMVGTELRR